MIRLAELGYDCVGVDLDASMLAVARKQSPGLPWFQLDLAEFEPALLGIAGGFDLVVAAGNIFPLLAPGTESTVVSTCPRHCVRAACWSPASAWTQPTCRCRPTSHCRTMTTAAPRPASHSSTGSPPGMPTLTTAAVMPSVSTVGEGVPEVLITASTRQAGDDSAQSVGGSLAATSLCGGHPPMVWGVRRLPWRLP